MNRVKVIAFDLGDTLVEYEGVPLNWEAHYPDALHALATHLDLPASPAQTEAASAVLRRYNTRLHPRTHEVSFAQLLAELLPCFGSASATVAELACATAFFRLFRSRLRCFPDTQPTLAALRARGLKLAVFTDVPYGMPRELVLADLADAGLSEAFDALLTSRDIGFRKPNPATLAHLAAALGCTPAEMIHVGNERKDIDVARAFGCRAVLLDRPGHHANWGQEETIASLSELPDLLGQAAYP